MPHKLQLINAKQEMWKNMLPNSRSTALSKSKICPNSVKRCEWWWPSSSHDTVSWHM